VIGLGFEGKLFILAFDHRGSFQQKFFGVDGKPAPEEAVRIADAKHVIFEGFLRALDTGADRTSAGILVDEQFGAAIARQAKAGGMILAMPAERSGQDEFEFEYGENFGHHVEEFDPTFCKVLVRFNPEGDGAMNARQATRLKDLSDWLHHRDRKLLFELIVPPEPHQLETVEGDSRRYDVEVRPQLMRIAISELQASGVEPDVWKIEGIDAREDCEVISEQCRTAGRDDVACIVLGRGADDAAVDHWLRTASGVPGYVGFAIGRSIWWDPLKDHVDAKLERAAASARVAENYRRFIRVYEQAGAERATS
jgi:myo-inositol catabolism protein IolC